MIPPPLCRWLFWGSAGTLGGAYVVFPLLAAVRALVRPRPVSTTGAGATPSVSLIVAAYDEAGVILRKIDNALALDYPRDRLEILVASDGSTDGTNELVRRRTGRYVRLLELPRAGKNETLNRAVAAARGEILVFSDADAMLPRDALRHLVAPFADPDVGAVAGERRQAGHLDSRRKRLLWTGKRALRVLLSRAGSATAAEGQLHAVRRELFRPVPPNVNDDFFISAQAVAAHRRLVYEPRAVSYPFEGSTELRDPFARKVRLTQRWLRAVWAMRTLLDAREHGFYAAQLVAHKLVRRMAFIPLSLLAITAPALWRHGAVYRVATLAQVGLHGAALLGLALGRRRLPGRRLLRSAYRFDMANAAAAGALVRLLRRDHDAQRAWSPQRAATGPPEEVARGVPGGEPALRPVDPVRLRRRRAVAPPVAS